MSKSKQLVSNMPIRQASEEYTHSHHYEKTTLTSSSPSNTITVTENEFDDVVKALLKTAETDGKVSSEEMEIINQVKIDVNAYQNALDLALDDGILTTDELQILGKLKQNIMDRVYVVANIDGEIDADERSLIHRLADILAKYV